MNRWILRSGALLCAVGLCLSMGLTAFAANDFDAITGHVDFRVPQTLNITKPSKNITTSAANYYLMGTSDPGQDLYMNGYPIDTRGQLGSFGVYITLSYGQNVVEFTQGSRSDRVVITRSDTVTLTPATGITSRFPTGADTAFRAGDTVSVSCVAPSGASVSATVYGQRFALKQVAATAQPGIAARFRADYVMPDTTGGQGIGNMGKVIYTLDWQGKTTDYSSAANLYTVGSNDELHVQVTQVSAALTDDADKNYVGTAKLGSVDRVIDMDAGRYKLSVGGWVSRENVRPLEGSASVQNLVSRVSFEQENGAEVYHFAGTSQPVAGAYRTGSQLIVELPHTTGISSVPTGKSSLFSSVSVTEKADSLLLTFELKPSAILWGYVVEYADGVTSLVCKYKPRLSGSADRPLEGIVVALDSGHGSADPGALGLAQLTGPTEAEINRATALATKKRLESLGATVYLPEQLDLNSRFNERMQPAISYRADLFISLHCNSIVDNANGLTPNGTEIYYFEAPGKALGDALLPQILSATGRAGRGVKWNAFRVTLNTLAPSVLIEMGFMTNPIDYDSLCSRQGVYQMANAVGDGIVALLS